MSKTGAAVRPTGGRTRASMPPTIKTRFSPAYFLFKLAPSGLTLCARTKIQLRNREKRLGDAGPARQVYPADG